MTLVSAGIPVSCDRLSVTSRCSTEIAKRTIMQKMPHDITGTLVFWCRKFWQNSSGVTPNEGSKCRSGRLNAGEVAENWQLSMWSVVNLVRSQVYHTESPPYFFAAHSLWCIMSYGFVSDSLSLLMLLWTGFILILFIPTIKKIVCSSLKSGWFGLPCIQQTS